MPIKKTPAKKKIMKTKAPARKKETILVTGGTSGLGRRIIEELLKRKYDVRVLLKAHPNKDEEWKSLPTGASVYVGDIGSTNIIEKEKLMEACRGVSAVYHFAAATSNAKSKYNEMINTNVVGTENVLRAYLDANADSDGKLKFIYSSSVTVYGHGRKGETLTEDSDLLPQSAYAESKYLAEQIVKAFAAANSRLDYTMFRIGIMYGPEYEHNFMRVFKLIDQKKLMLIGSGDNHLTMVNIDDVAQAMMLALEDQKHHNSIYNLTDGNAYTQKELFRKAAMLLNAEEPKKSVHPFLAKLGAKSRGIDIDQFSFITSDRIVSIDKIKRELGFKPKVSIDKGGKELADDYIKKHRTSTFMGG